MMPPAEDLARFIAAAGVGEFGGISDWGIYANIEPTAPANSITLYDSGGGPPDTDQLDLLQPMIQVRVRSVVSSDGRAKQDQIRDLLILPGRIQTGRSNFLGVMMTSDVINIGRDDSNRFLSTANYQTIRERV